MQPIGSSVCRIRHAIFASTVALLGVPLAGRRSSDLSPGTAPLELWLNYSASSASRSRSITDRDGQATAFPVLPGCVLVGDVREEGPWPSPVRPPIACPSTRRSRPVLARRDAGPLWPVQPP